MITLKTLRWSNAFSYGPNNTINFDTAPLTQLVGRNGHGKSSIALILEEVLFNKNSKGIKKADIINRHLKEKSYSIELDFSRDGTNYSIKSTRGTTQTVKLFREGVDISSHTATATYKAIEEIIGIDHKAFSQIVYQSNASSLEFLTAPDTARKKFLIEILNLGKYTRAQEVFKDLASELSKEVSSVQAQVNTVKAWLDKYSNADLSTMELITAEEVNPEKIAEASKIQDSLNSIESINKKISQNNTYKQLQSNIKILPVVDKPVEDSSLKSRADATNKAIIEYKKDLDNSKVFVSKIHGLSGTCPTCLQSIDSEKLQDLVTEQQELQSSIQSNIDTLLSELSIISNSSKEYITALDRWKQAQKSQDDWEKYHQLIDQSMADELLDKESLQKQLVLLETSILSAKKAVAAAEKHNNAASAHNAKVEMLKKQLVEMNEELELHSGNLHLLSERMSIVNILNKTFSTTGLVAYKIECLVKDLEELTNSYLVDLSDGRFQISFKVNSSDKLNVVVTDNGKDIEILALSGGEKARVNVATLLAIRKLMQTLSSSRINLLILDETVEALDLDGKEKLVEVLLKEEHLNTFLVSHGFTHPLLEKINVVKKHNISQIEV